MDGAWEAGNEVMITTVKKHPPQACSLKPLSGGGLAHGRTQWGQPDTKQGNRVVGSWEGPDEHTPRGPGDTPNPWVRLGTRVPGRPPQILGKNLENLGVCQPHGSICRIRLGIWYEEPPCTGPRGNPHAQVSLPKAEESLLPSAVPATQT